MEAIIAKGTAEEITALVLAVQGRQECDAEEERRKFHELLESWSTSSRTVFSE